MLTLLPVKEIIPLGDSALLVRLGEELALNPEDALTSVQRLTRALRHDFLPGIIEVVPAYTSVAIFFDVMRLIEAGVPANEVHGWLVENIQQRMEPSLVFARPNLRDRLIEIPVCYDDDFAWDLTEIARAKNLSRDEIVRRHTAASYRVQFLGFTPGFPYLSGLPPELTMPRRAQPRTKVSAGSVAIGGNQAGIYAHESPGGWSIIGRTPLRLFDTHRQPPASLEPGDSIKFRAISRAEFDSLGE